MGWIIAYTVIGIVTFIGCLVSVWWSDSRFDRDEDYGTLVFVMFLCGLIWPLTILLVGLMGVSWGVGRIVKRAHHGR